jgi:excisionase family DNA binding protein
LRGSPFDIFVVPVNPIETYLSVAEAAALLRVHERTLYNRIADGSIKSVRIGRTIRIPKEQFVTHLVAKMPENVIKI